MTEMMCPHCHSKNGQHTPAEGGRQNPMKGDLSVCIHCNNLTRFDEDIDGDLYMRKVSNDEILTMIKEQPDLEKQLRQAEIITDALKQIIR